MKRISVRETDSSNILKVDLKDVLRIMGDMAVQSTWKVSGVEALGEEAADEMHLISDSKTTIDGARLIGLADAVWQVVAGQFEAYLGNDSSPWCIIRAVDSSAYDIETDAPYVLEEIRNQYVTEICP